MDRSKKKKAKREKQFKGHVLISHIEGISERTDTVFKEHNVSMSMFPHCTLRTLLVHPKDKCELEE